MASFTTRLGLTKPAGNEDRAVGPLNTNSDLLDKFFPYILVNDGVTPPTGDLYDGAAVKERTSGIIWEARKNGGGTYDKVYVRYPYSFAAYHNTTPVGRTTDVWPNFVDSGYNTIISALCKNSSASDLSSDKWKVPIKGIYQLLLRNGWAGSAGGVRGICLRINGTNIITGPNNTTKEVNSTSGSSDTLVDIAIPYLLNANDLVTAGAYQRSGGTIKLNHS